MNKISRKELINIRFGLLYRKLALNDMSNDGLNKMERALLDSNMHVENCDVDGDLLKYSIRDIFFEKDSSQLFWLYRSLYNDGTTMLHRLSPSMKAVSGIVRGGLNVYKRMGWDIHVLYAYQLICDNFSTNKPTFVEGVFDDFSIYQNIENKLDEECRFVLRLATFLHDIGVVDGVKDHEKNGVKWVETRIKELEITEDFLLLKGFNLSIGEVNEIMRFIIGNHQMINQIGSEISDAYAAKRILSGAKRLNGYGMEFFNNHIADIMYLLSAADLMAVDDTLLTKQKSLETKESFAFFSTVMKKGLFERNKMTYGIQRFRSLLKDSMKDAFSDDFFINLVTDIGYNPYEIAEYMYFIPQMNYAMTYVKPQSSYAVGLKMFCLVFEYMKNHSLDPKCTNLKFDPDIDYIGAGKYLEMISVKEALERGRIKLDYDANGKNLNINFEV